jgi:2-dehydropantoate 2-reductase
MDILVFGAGAVGGFLGGRLAEAGHTVTFIARGQTAEAIQENGLSISEGGKRRVVHPNVVPTLRQALLASTAYSLVLLTMKAYDAEAALNELVAFYPEPPPLITLQNGIGVEEMFIKEFGADRVIAGSLTTPLSRETNHSILVERSDRGLALAPTNPSLKIDHWATMFTEAGLPTVIIKDYRAMKWSKAMLNMVGNATAAILNRHPKIVYDYGPTFRLEMAMIKEMVKVMDKRSIKTVALPGASARKLVLAVLWLPEVILQPVLTRIVAQGRGDKLPSFQLDLTAGKTDSEVLFHNGAVAEAGRSLGVPTPVNAALNDILLKLARKELGFEDFNGKPKHLVLEVRKYRGQG